MNDPKKDRRKATMAAGPVVYCRVRRYRQWVYVLCDGELTRTLRTPELDLWLDRLGIKVSGRIPVTDPD